MEPAILKKINSSGPQARQFPDSVTNTLCAQTTSVFKGNFVCWGSIFAELLKYSLSEHFILKYSRPSVINSLNCF